MPVRLHRGIDARVVVDRHGDHPAIANGSTTCRAVDALLAEPTGWLAALTGRERAELQALYRVRGSTPLWVDERAYPTAAAGEAVRLLAAAADEGLDPAAYEASALTHLAMSLGGHAAPLDVARFELTASAALLRYLRHLHAGRVDPREIGFRLHVPGDDHDYAAAVAAASGGHVRRTAETFMPQIGAYRDLRAALARYRRLAADPSLSPPPATRRPVHPGTEYAGAAELRRLLHALGDLPPETATSPRGGRYEGVLVEGVRRFQARHGLTADGVIGAVTSAALHTPLGWRVRQIELGLERLRWLPHADRQRLVLVNIPMFRLWAWDSVPPLGPPALTTDVIVGRALSTQTPVFTAALREVIFRPAWNVPASIVRNEIVPSVRRDPGYLGAHDMEIIVPATGRVVPSTPDNIARLGRDYGVRQRPGPRNSLGLVKFMFPNHESVYMHDSPATALFSRSRRDFSHGCVRVRDPVALAEWALAGREGWDRDRIGSSMLAAQTVHVTLARETLVVLFYTTALVSPDDSRLRFAEDIYRHDRRLDSALAR